MTQQTKPSIVQLSHHHCHQLFDNKVRSFVLHHVVFSITAFQNKYSSIKKKRPNAVIRVTIGLPKTLHSV